MKTKIFMTIAAAATLLSACDKNNEMETPWNGEIRLSSGVTVQQTRANDANVPDKQIASGQSVQVVVTKQTADTKTYAGYDQALTAGGDGTFTGGTPMFYPESGMGVSIYAFHPSSAPASFVANADQSSNANYFNSDLLYSDKKDYTRQSAAHSLTFEHKLSKLTYTLLSGTGSPNITGATVKWTNVCNTAAFDKTTGGVTTPSYPTIIIPHATYGAIIVPQTVGANTQLLEVTLADGAVLKYTPNTDQVFEGKKKYNYEITVNLSGLTVTSTITDWESVSKRTGNATM